MVSSSSATIAQTRARVEQHPSKLGGFDGLQAGIVQRTLAKIQKGSLHLRMPDGVEHELSGTSDGPVASMQLNRGRLLTRYLNNGAVGFAEGFIEGDFDSPDLATLLELLDRNYDAFSKSYYGPAYARLLRKYQHWRNDNSKTGSRNNIHAHYDLGNEFFGAWLDPTMTYSSALFESPNTSLEDGQHAKYENLCQIMGLRPGHELLEIGTGWGGFAIHAARHHGAKITTITISKEQFNLAQKRVQQAGLGERIDVRFQDYRDVEGRFDRIASIEMFEAVGERYWPVFFEKLSSCLRDGGRAGLQIITIADPYFDAYRQSADFIQRYVFPGGCLPSPSALRLELNKVGLQERAWQTFGADYARTLQIWSQRFLAAWDTLEPLGFDERFKRIWRYYLAYCEAGFRTGSTDVVQIGLSKA